MTHEYSTFRLANVAINDNENELKQILSVGELTLICTLIFDTDVASDTYNHWICTLDVVSDTEDIPERSFVLYPNTILFGEDALYSAVITSELDSIGHDDLQNTFLTLGVPVNE